MCLFQPCLQQFHYMIPFLSGDAFKLAKSLPSNLNFCFPLLSFMDAVPLIVTIFVLLPVSPSLLSVFPLLTIPLENLMPPHPGPWWAHSHLSTLSTLHPHFMLSKQPKSHKLPSEWVEPVSLARLKISGGKTPVSVLFRSHIGRGKSRIEGKLRIGREGGVNLPSERWSGVSFSSEISIDSLLNSHGNLFLFVFVHLERLEKGGKLLKIKSKTFSSDKMNFLKRQLLHMVCLKLEKEREKWPGFLMDWLPQ